MNEVVERVSKLQNAVDEIDLLKADIKDLRIKFLRQENALVECEVRINGIPYVKDENLLNLFTNICGILNIRAPRLKSIHLHQNRNNTKIVDSSDAVIIANMMFPYDKNLFLKSVSGYKKLNNNLLCLDAIGLNS